MTSPYRDDQGSHRDVSTSDAVLDELRQLRRDQLRPAAADRVHPGLPAADHAFLTTVGLPVFEPDIGVAASTTGSTGW
jgi:hypothetical protein